MHGALTAMQEGVRIRVRGQVQGVGFRPFVWQLAQRFNIKGTVLNDPEGVLIHAVGVAIPDFLAALESETPPLARIDGIEHQPFDFCEPPEEFRIVKSEGHGTDTRVTPDAATCASCVADIFGSDPRRRGYAFTNCTHCGPRFTILRRMPYDRQMTSMASFEMCSDCAREYADPADRRFHAQPIACASCGPQLWLEHGGVHSDKDAIDRAAERLLQGDILAIKGLGGFHLACDATNEMAIAKLRERKHRPAKPLALMGRHQEIARYAVTDPASNDLLYDPAAPIVLLPTANLLPWNLAPGQVRLGWMLPYTPLHHLLMEAVGRPLVMTSGNVSGEPQVIGNEEAREKLRAIVDGFLMHNRDIERRLDDSVEQVTPHGPMTLRRARGRVPTTLPLPEGFEDVPQTTAFGGHLKSAICLLKNGQALLSHHLGDLDEALTFDEFCKADADYAALFDHDPDVFACDLHDGYQSSQHALRRAGQRPLVAVQHHHAHLASCMSDNAWPLESGAVAGIILDGLGLGTDGTIWGGELLVGDYCTFRRVLSLEPACLVGGDAAQRQPWRNAVMRLDMAGLADASDRLFAEQPVDLIRQAAAARMNSLPSSSAGRLFDAVAAVLGLCPDAQSFEGEAAMRLEALATMAPEYLQKPYPFGRQGDLLTTGPLFECIVDDLEKGISAAAIAARFHAGLAKAFAAPAVSLVSAGEAQAVALSGGCFQNATLQSAFMSALGDVPVMLHRSVPANDGGLAMGQALIAAARSVSGR
ncbi:carbamoyltransferase HypF [Roseibium sp. HPY-6]|uniref:carbamoyltransferase HypF n=1 Tax=Roseibium sp. HPY-6 TaxID=3229852 RepID=UPI00338F9016